MTYREHWDMVIHSVKLVAIGFLAILMIISFVFASVVNRELDELIFLPNNYIKNVVKGDKEKTEV